MSFDHLSRSCRCSIRNGAISSPLSRRFFNNALSPHHENFFPFIAVMGRNATPPIMTFFRSATTTTVTVTESQRESKLKVKKLVKLCANLHPRVQYKLAKHRKQSREAASKVCCLSTPRATFSYVLTSTPVSHSVSACTDLKESARFSTTTCTKLKTFTMAN